MPIIHRTHGRNQQHRYNNLLTTERDRQRDAARTNSGFQRRGNRQHIFGHFHSRKRTKSFTHIAQTLSRTHIGVVWGLLYISRIHTRGGKDVL